MPKRVTLSDIAREAGVSAAAVSMAMRGEKRVSAETRKRIHEIAAKLGYVYDRGAAMLRTGRSDTIGLVVGDVANPFFGELVAGVDEALNANGHISLLACAREDANRQTQLLTRLREEGVGGIILCPAPDTDETLLDETRSWSVPVIQMLRWIAPRRGDYVSIDYRSGVEALVDHLYRLGHRRFAFVGGDLKHSATLERHQGFRAALARHDLPADLVLKVPATRAAGRNAAEKLMAAEDRPTAIVCYNDLTALGVNAALRRRGIVPGEDIAVTGFDNIEEAGEAEPALTTVASNPRQIGLEAGRALLRRLAEPVRSDERIVLPAPLIIRESCGHSAGESVPPPTPVRPLAHTPSTSTGS